MSKEIIKELSQNYGISEQRIIEYKNLLQEYPFILDSEPEYMEECLEMIVSERASQKLIKEKTKKRSLTDTISYALYKVYGEKSIIYLNEKFLERNALYSKRIVPSEEMSIEEVEYEGYDYDDYRPPRRKRL